ncbi:MAG TPA: 3-carboxy-cis,cis-muconate cycloisomerase [Hyphomicrobiaceae bacterium]|nr:3-carboxy-cis,cis-muconate cycloisomerase [Hyphomicrobiaceae bacterium]
MPATVFDSGIFRDAFGAPAMRAVFDDAALIARYVEVEVALAAAEAKAGVIPKDAAAAIKRLARADAIDMGRLKEETDLVGYPIVGVVHQLARQCGEAGRYVHWGATTQDIMDTATVLQVREALGLVADDLAALEGTLAALADKHRATVMAGRTHLQHALPVTFGHKAAVWLGMVVRHRQRLEQLRPRVLVGQFAGAAGTLASLGDRGLAVHDALMAELGLGRPATPWHAARDGLAETVSFLALVAGTLAKIATDVMLMMQTEVGEAFEPFLEGRGSSSTMPQKRNPISCELILAAARIVRQHAGLMLDAMAADHERATGPWQLEWVAVPEAFLAVGGALRQARFMADGLIVDAGRMRRNLDITGGLIVAEAVMMALAKHTGRGAAHDLIYGACRAALDKGSTLLDELKRRPEVTDHLDADRLAELTDPVNYLGSAQAMIDRALAARPSPPKRKPADRTGRKRRTPGTRPA